MASLLFEFSDKKVYTFFSTLEEAYFFCKKIFKKLTSYEKVISHLNNYYMATVGCDETIKIMIYYGNIYPPKMNEDIKFVKKEIIIQCI